jgi:hypothetical protein
MKKREFLAAGGAVPLMLAGCGGNSSGSAPVRLVNASVGYPNLGLEVETTMATTTDVAYGSASPFTNVQAGSVTTTLTTTTNGVVTFLPVQTRTLNKDQRYSIIAFGYANAPKSLLLSENAQTITSGYASFNVLNTSTDVGAVDVYLTATTDLSNATPIASSIAGGTQAAFTFITAGSYFVTIVGAGSIAAGRSDVRYKSATAIALADQQIATLILSPGVSGVLVNAILMTQGTSGTVVNMPNTNARLRAVAATGPSVGPVAVANVLLDTASPNVSEYALVAGGPAPDVRIGGSGGTILPNAGTLVAGNDYTLLIYLDATTGNPTTSLIVDDNRLPVSAVGCKVRMLNAVRDAAGTSQLLTLSVNANTIASNVAYGTASTYTEVAALATSVIEVTSGFSVVIGDQTITLSAGSIYTEIVATGAVTSSNPTGTFGKFIAARL